MTSPVTLQMRLLSASRLVSHKHPAGKTMKIVEVPTEIHQARPHHLLQARGDDSVGGVVTKPDGGVSFMGGLKGLLNYNTTEGLEKLP